MRKTPAYYRHLAIEIAELEVATVCSRIESQLEEYGDATLSGEDARGMYPSVWTHLQGCARCRQEYAALIAEGTEE